MATFQLHNRSEVEYQTRIDEVSATVSYVGDTQPGVATSEAAWRIKKIDTTSGTVITWAEGSSAFDKTWDSRGDYTYS